MTTAQKGCPMSLPGSMYKVIGPVDWFVCCAWCGGEGFQQDYQLKKAWRE
jgi:hypothetical protein